jgi:hypothetical protein
VFNMYFTYRSATTLSFTDTTIVHQTLAPRIKVYFVDPPLLLYCCNRCTYSQHTKLPLWSKTQFCDINSCCSDLTFICPCIASISLKYRQQDATFSRSAYFYNLLHVSGGSSTHHQEHKTVRTASGIVKPILLPAAVVDEMKLLRVPSHPR